MKFLLLFLILLIVACGECKHNHAIPQPVKDKLVETKEIVMNVKRDGTDVPPIVQSQWHTFKNRCQKLADSINTVE